MIAAPGWRLGFAVAVIGGLGLAHGASDLAIVEARRRAAFLLVYLAAAAACLVWWVASPAIALPLFLAASAIHFGLEDAPADRPVERAARGALMITGPAVLHRPELAAILEAATGDAGLAGRLAYGMAVIGVPSLIATTVIAARRRDWALLTGAAALVTPPPLIGFPVGFILLHAWPQTLERIRRLGCGGLMAYLRLTAPVLAGAALIALITAWLMRDADPAGLRALFAGLAALAVPHMLVTPWFERAHLDFRGRSEHLPAIEASCSVSGPKSPGSASVKLKASLFTRGVTNPRLTRAPSRSRERPYTGLNIS